MIPEYELSRITKKVDRSGIPRPYIRIMWREYGAQIDIPEGAITSAPKWRNAIHKIRTYCASWEIKFPDEAKLLKNIKELVKL